MLKLAKIVCTLGPACADAVTIKKMICAGMNVARLNFSHGKYADLAEMIKIVRQCSVELDGQVAVLADLCGPKIRIGEIAGVVELQSGAAFTLTTAVVVGNKSIATIENEQVFEALQVADTIMINDGLVRLVVTAKAAGEIHTKVLAGGPISSHKGVNVPSCGLSVPSLTEKDKRDLRFAISHGVDFVALSFVRRPEDIEALIAEMKVIGSRVRVPIIAKIEKEEAVANLAAIVSLADGVMVARGDLGVEMPIEDVPVVQKKIIAASNQAGKFVITATQMMESMVTNKMPTRAEVTDVANAVIDGSDALMLSAETSVGDDPVLVVSYMARIIVKAEAHLREQGFTRRIRADQGMSTEEAVGHGACQIRRDTNADMIVTYTNGGTTARLIAKHRPMVPVLALTPSIKVAASLAIVHGVLAKTAEDLVWSDQIVERFVQVLDRIPIEQMARPGKVVITAGLPLGDTGRTNLIRVVDLDCYPYCHLDRK